MLPVLFNSVKYVVDSDALINLFRHYPQDIFKQLWINFDVLIKNGNIISSSEVLKEIGGRTDALSKWAKRNGVIFIKPSSVELDAVKDILAIPEFQSIIKPNPSTAEKPIADPFIIAQAKCRDCILVTDEKLKQNKIRIPNVCEHYGIGYLNLHDFFREEKWSF